MKFQILDIKIRYKTTDSLRTFIRLFGRTISGESVCCDVYGAPFYFYTTHWRDHYVQSINQHFSKAYGKCRCPNCAGWKTGRNEPCKDVQRAYLDETILKTETVYGKSFVGYCEDQNPFTKVYVSHPFLIRPITWHLESKLEQEMILPEWFETDVPPAIRFCTDFNINPAGWVEVGGTVVDDDEVRVLHHVSVDLELDQTIIPNEFAGNCPLSIMYTDIECISMVDRFPQAKCKCSNNLQHSNNSCYNHQAFQFLNCNYRKVCPVLLLFCDYDQHVKMELMVSWFAGGDPIIQIACVAAKHGIEGHTTTLFTLGSCSPIDGATVVCSSTETELLNRLRLYIIENDFDIISGYNSDAFDLPYIFERAEQLKIKNFPDFSRERGFPSFFKKSVFQSAQAGTIESIHWTIPGIIPFDLLPLCRKTFKLGSYKLNNVAKAKLNDQKEDLDYKLLRPLQQGTADDRKRIGTYCIQDTVLVKKLTDKLQLLVNNIEVAKVIGITLFEVLTRGQTHKVKTKLLQTTSKRNIFLPTFPRDKATGHIQCFWHNYVVNKKQQEAAGGKAKFKGATVSFY